MEKRLEILFIYSSPFILPLFFVVHRGYLNVDPFCQCLFDHIIAEFNFSLATDEIFCHLWDNPFPP